MSCYCGQEREYEECCKPFHDDLTQLSTAEECMRARYSAFVVANIDFLEQTHHPDQSQEYSIDDIRKWASDSEWIKLEILKTAKGLAKDSEGEVEFKAHYNINGRRIIHHEVSQFVKKNNQWFYFSGDILNDNENKTYRRELPKVGRNDQCPCGSGKKYKKCCDK